MKIIFVNFSYLCTQAHDLITTPVLFHKKKNNEYNNTYSLSLRSLSNTSVWEGALGGVGIISGVWKS